MSRTRCGPAAAALPPAATPSLVPSPELQDYSKIIKIVDTTGFEWLNFDMTWTEKFKLFARGVMAAKDFLSGGGDSPAGFNWAEYKELRQSLRRSQHHRHS